MADDRTDFDALIPELEDWNNGDGISPDGWIGCVGSTVAVGYSLIFWPRFVRFEDMCFARASAEPLRGFEPAGRKQPGVGRVGDEPRHLADIHFNMEKPANEAQLRYLGRVLKEIHRSSCAPIFRTCASKSNSTTSRASTSWITSSASGRPRIRAAQGARNSMTGRTDAAARLVHASPDAVYDAFIDPEALMAWLPPARHERPDVAVRALGRRPLPDRARPGG